MQQRTFAALPLQQLEARHCIFRRIMSRGTSILDFPTQPFARQPFQARLAWSTLGMREQESGIDHERMSDFERQEIVLKRMTEEDRAWRDEVGS